MCSRPRAYLVYATSTRCLRQLKSHCSQRSTKTDAAVTSDHLPELYCEPRQIEYTLTCLIENAIKFRRETQPEIHVSASLESDAWLFKVSDNGIGIDPRYHATHLRYV